MPQDGLTSKQTRALTALLTCDTVEAAAVQAHVGVRTLFDVSLVACVGSASHPGSRHPWSRTARV
jgi:hypothetical protein